MKNKTMLFSFMLFFFLFANIIIYAAPVHEINKEYDKEGNSYKVVAAFFSRDSSSQALLFVDMEINNQISQLPTVVVSEKELKLAVQAFNDFKKDNEFKEWSNNADYYVCIFAVNTTTKTGEAYYLTYRLVGKKEAIKSTAWIINPQ